MSISVLGGVPIPNSEASLGGGVGSLAMVILLLVMLIDELHHLDFMHRYDRSFNPCHGNPLVLDKPFAQYDLEVTFFRAAGPFIRSSVKPSLPL